jgi:hypothetical protein
MPMRSALAFAVVGMSILGSSEALAFNCRKVSPPGGYQYLNVRAAPYPWARASVPPLQRGTYIAYHRTLRNRTGLWAEISGINYGGLSWRNQYARDEALGAPFSCYSFG